MLWFNTLNNRFSAVSVPLGAFECWYFRARRQPWTPQTWLSSRSQSGRLSAAYRPAELNCVAACDPLRRNGSALISAPTPATPTTRNVFAWTRIIAARRIVSLTEKNFVLKVRGEVGGAWARCRLRRESTVTARPRGSPGTRAPRIAYTVVGHKHF